MQLSIAQDASTNPSQKTWSLEDLEIETINENMDLINLKLDKHMLEIILGLSQKVISNYTNHIANTPVDAPFQKFAWPKENVLS